MKTIIAILLSVICLSLRADTHTAASCSLADVNTAVSAASAGDTVSVPGGTATWSSALSITQALNVIGAGTNNTVITCSGQAFDVSYSTGVGRISGFRLNATGGGTSAYGMTLSLAKAARIRVDNCWMQNFYWMFEVYACGLVDHCTFIDFGYRVARTDVPSQGGNPSMSEQNTARTDWYPVDFTSTNAMFFENCIIVDTSWGDQTLFTAQYAGSYVVRNCQFYLNTSGYVQGFDFHGNQGEVPGTEMRGTIMMGVYSNTFNITGSTISCEIYVRAGSGLVFGNTFDKGSGYMKFYEEDSGSTWGGPFATMYDPITNIWVWGNSPSMTSANTDWVGNTENDENCWVNFATPSPLSYTTYPHPLISGETATNPPSITGDLADVTTGTNQTATFTLTATGDGTLLYSWTTNTVAAWSTSNTLVFTGTTLAMSNTAIQAIVTNDYGSATSSVKHLYVTNGVAAAPSNAPTSLKIIGGRASFGGRVQM